jgi:hypothetical protein
MCLTTKY